MDSGDRDLAWRSDPNEVARRFALDVLRWPGESGSGLAPASEDAAVLRYHVINVQPGTSCDQIVADVTCPKTSLTLTLRRLGRPDGLWSIVQVSSNDLALGMAPGEEIASGTTIDLPTTLPEGEKVSMGVGFLTSCDATGSDENVEVSGGMLEFTVPDVPDGCTGYVYAMTPKTGVGAVAIGSFLFTDAPDVPAIGYLVDEIAAVPVSFTSGTASVPSDVAEFACDGTGTITPTRSVVAAQPDGVHIAITNTAATPVSYTVGRSVSDPIGGGGAPPGERARDVWQLPPGSATVSCSAVSDGGTGVASPADLQVVDPLASYVSADLGCTGGQSGLGSAYPEGAVGVQGDPVEIARQHLSGLEFDDRVERAGYPESSLPVVRVVRRGGVVASATFLGDGAGGWLLETLDVCTGVPIGWRDEVTGVSGPMGPSSNA